MCLRAYPNGDGIGNGTHLSLFFVIMKGEFDALLKWPFQQRVTITLLDQSTLKDHISLTFKPDSQSTAFQKPASEMNVGSGFPQFVSVDKLRTPTNYNRDDTLYIRVAVDTTGLVVNY